MAQQEPKLQTEIKRLKLTQLKALEVNARYMTAEQQQRLTANIARDGQLTSLPLVWLIQDEKGPAKGDPVYEILSGNHRVVSAKDAGFEEIDCIIILNWISPERRIEIQLSHNAVEGQDDVSILEGLYAQLDLAGKEYSGLDDEIFTNMQDIDLTGLGVGAPEYQELSLTFLPADIEIFTNLLAKIQKGKAKTHVFAHIKDFDTVFDTVVKVKETHNIQNSAMALIHMAELANTQMDTVSQLEGEEGEGEVVVIDDEPDSRAREDADK